MTYLKKPQEEEEGQGQQTSFMTSQGAGMLGAGGGEGGLGVAGGSPTGSSPFVNPEEYKNIRAGQRLGESLQRTFTDPAKQISAQIGTERGAFEDAAKKQQLSFLGAGGKDALLERARKDPLSFGQNVSELKGRYGTQYTGPMQFQASEKITDPLAKLQERMSTYGTQGGPGTGIEREDIRRSLIGEIMKPGTAGEGKLSLEENLLTSSPDNLRNLANIIGRVGYTGEGPQTTFSGSQAVPTPIARLNRAREELAELVERRQKEAADTRARATEAIQTGAGKIEGDVRTAIDQAVADAEGRQGLLDVKGRGEDWTDEKWEEHQETASKPFNLLPEMFRGEYTDAERALAKRLGLTDEQVEQGQESLGNLLDPWGQIRYPWENPLSADYDPNNPLDENKSGKGLIENWRDEGYLGTDFAGGVTFPTVNPLDTLFSFLDPEQVYTQEQMINPEQAQTLAALQGIMGQAPSITRAEDALGADAKAIQMGNVDDWLSNLAFLEQEQRDIATQRRDDRIAAQEEAKLEADFGPPKRTGNHQKDTENYLKWRERMESLAKEEQTVKEQIDKYDRLKQEFDDYGAAVENGSMDYDQDVVDDFRAEMAENDPGIIARIRNDVFGMWATNILKEEANNQKKADQDALKPKPTTGGGSGGGYNRPGIDDRPGQTTGQGWGGGDTGVGSDQSQTGTNSPFSP